jgi:hypothetical protein
MTETRLAFQRVKKPHGSTIGNSRRLFVVVALNLHRTSLVEKSAGIAYNTILALCLLRQAVTTRSHRQAAMDMMRTFQVGFVKSILQIVSVSCSKYLEGSTNSIASCKMSRSRAL